MPLGGAGRRHAALRPRRSAGRGGARRARAGCGGAAATATARCASGRWAARARSSPSCCRSSSAAQSRHPRPRPAAPVDAAHEKLLTAFAGDATPDLCQLGNTWVPELGALGAIEPLDARAAPSRGIAARRLFRRHARRPTSSTAGRWGVPWYADTRLLFYRSDLLRARRHARAARRLGGLARAPCGRSRRARRRAHLCAPAAAQRVRAAARARAAAGRAAAARRRPLRQFLAPAVSARARLLHGPVPRGPRAARDQRRRSPTSGTSSRAAASPSTSPARGTSASSSAGCPPTGRTTG